MQSISTCTSTVVTLTNTYCSQWSTTSSGIVSTSLDAIDFSVLPIPVIDQGTQPQEIIMSDQYKQDYANITTAMNLSLFHYYIVGFFIIYALLKMYHFLRLRLWKKNDHYSS